MGKQPLTNFVFSAHAEVVPKGHPLGAGLEGILRARGGSSEKQEIIDLERLYSPRTRR